MKTRREALYWKEKLKEGLLKLTDDQLLWVFVIDPGLGFSFI